MFFIVTLRGGNELAAGEDAPGIGVRPGHSALKDDGELEVIGSSDLSA